MLRVAVLKCESACALCSCFLLCGGGILFLQCAAEVASLRDEAIASGNPSQKTNQE